MPHSNPISQRNRIFVCLLLLFTACTSSDLNSELLVFRYNHTSPVSTLDPAFAKSQNVIWACHHIYSTLFDFDTTTQIQTNLVDTFSISKDGKEYYIEIIDNVYFHDNKCFKDGLGKKLTAYDVSYSLNRLLDDSIQSPGSWILKDRLITNGITVIDSFNIKLTLKEPFAPFLGLLATKYCSIVAKEAVEYYGSAFRSNPVGTGPFKFKKWIDGEALYLVKHPNYFKHDVAIDGVKATYITDKKIAFLELLQGNLDYVSGLESSFSVRLLSDKGRLRPAYDGDIKLWRAPYLNTEYIGINQKSDNKVLRIKEFRQALNYAIDRVAMLSTLRRSIGVPARNGIIHSGLNIPVAQQELSFKPALAKKLLNAIDYDKKYSQFPITIQTNADYLDLMTFVASQWQGIGINVEIEVLESSLLRQGMRSGDVDVFRASWIADYPDAENFLCLFYGDNPAPPNYTRYNNEAFDKLYSTAVEEIDPMIRQEYYRALDDMLIEDCPVVFLYYDETAVFTSKKFAGIEVNSLNMLEVEHLRLAH